MRKSLPQKTLPAMLVVGVVSGCGGNSAGQESANQNSVEQIDTVSEHAGEIEPASMAMTGTIIVEERNGKTVFDAYFSKIPAAEPDAIEFRNISRADTCAVSTLSFDATNNESVELGAANSSAEYSSIGAALNIESRVGQFEALLKQQAGDLTVYAPNDRWQSGALPEDAILSFEEESAFSHMDAVDVPPLLPLVWLAPDTGVMSNAASSLKWEASFNEQVRIKLQLSAIDFRDSKRPVVTTVACDVIDDGLFTLPAEHQRQLPDDASGIVVYAVRERVQNIRVNETSLTVVQLSYPAPL